MSSKNNKTDKNDCNLAPFEKNRYFNGKLMTSRDMLAEQQYHRTRLNTINRFVIGSGLLCGLKVTSVRQNGNKLRATVGDGVAIDCCGDPIIVRNAPEKGVTPSGTPEELENASRIYLYLSWASCDKESVPKGGSENACKTECEYNRILETFELTYETSPPQQIKRVRDVHFPQEGPWTEAVENPDSSVYTSEEHQALITTARKYYQEHLSACGDCTDKRIFLGTFEKETGGGDDEDGGPDENTAQAWTEVQPNDPERSLKSYVYTNDMVYAALSRHAANFNNPHEVDLTVGPTEAGVTHPRASIQVEGGKSARKKVHFDSSDDSISIDVIEGSENVEDTIDFTAEGDADLDAVKRYLMDRTLKCILKHFSGVAERFEGTSGGEIAGQIVALTETTIEDEVLWKKGPTEQSFINFFLSIEEDGETREGFLSLGERLDTTLDQERTATGTSREWFHSAIDEINDLFGSQEPPAPENIDVIEIATVQERVCEAAERLEIDLLCADFNELSEDDQLAGTVEVRDKGTPELATFQFSPFAEEGPWGRVSDIWPRAGLLGSSTQGEDGNFEIQIQPRLPETNVPQEASALIRITFPPTFYVEAEVVTGPNFAVHLLPLARGLRGQLTPIAQESTPRNLVPNFEKHTLRARGQRISGAFLLIEGVNLYQRFGLSTSSLLLDFCVGRLEAGPDEFESVEELDSRVLSEELRRVFSGSPESRREVPDLVGLSRERAEETLSEGEWPYRIETGRAEDVIDRSGRRIGDVIEQTPAAAEEIPPGTEITVHVVGSPSVRRIDGVGDTRERALVDTGIETVEDLAGADVETITNAAGVSEATARDWIDTADLYRQSYELTQIKGIGIEEAEILAERIGVHSLDEALDTDPAEFSDRIHSAAEAEELPERVADRLLSIDWNSAMRELDARNDT